jgi:hypothetical protein
MNGILDLYQTVALTIIFLCWAGLFVYFIAKMGQFLWLYMQGEPVPELSLIISKRLFTFAKVHHPVDILLVTLFCAGWSFAIGVFWIIAVPLIIIYFIRQRNIHKKKMWNILKGTEQ